MRSSAIKFMKLFNHSRHRSCATFNISPNKFRLRVRTFPLCTSVHKHMCHKLGKGFFFLALMTLYSIIKCWCVCAQSVNLWIQQRFNGISEFLSQIAQKMICCLIVSFFSFSSKRSPPFILMVFVCQHRKMCKHLHFVRLCELEFECFFSGAVSDLWLEIVIIKLYYRT